MIDDLLQLKAPNKKNDIFLNNDYTLLHCFIYFLILTMSTIPKPVILPNIKHNLSTFIKILFKKKKNYEEKTDIS